LIELDGSGHTELKTKTKDEVKQNFAKSQGYKIVRFWNNDLEKNIEGVLEEIKKQI
jgi:very-short-patch-repair endonuclease